MYVNIATQLKPSDVEFSFTARLLYYLLTCLVVYSRKVYIIFNYLLNCWKIIELQYWILNACST